VIKTQLSGTVFIVDDDPLIRASLEATLTSVGLRTEKFASADQFLLYAGPHQVGCLLVDVRMPGMDGLQLQEELLRRNGAISVLIMTGHADVTLAVRAMKSGAVDILEKPFKRETLLAKISVALEIANQKSAGIEQSTAREAKLLTLTSREREVVILLAAGQSNKEIARNLNLSSRTVEVHRARAMEKLEVESLAALVLMTANIASA
jgi:two-component system response regulator FixJ